ncbi:tail fiber domain-containing protein [Rhodopseudomonas sp. P2A-2r]|uniref:tail fiber domain-containing protein n=1 Tax=Rhodopseudomonas sp. P2A-2r TaxID=2991972 RepID=UPI0022349439|nr:tail fiber domain-containing protein [Rhodopseudomonas sp. P2A-2r]UZE51914.1 tail fiber domain-containing protein [Rhodopseudomonas sp. P2A-2r]
MGGTSKTSQDQTQTSQLNPYSAASGSLTGILGALGNQVGGAGTLNPAQTGAINTMSANGAAGDPNAAASTAGVAGLLNGGGAKDNNAAILKTLTDYQGLLGSTASGANIGANSALRPQLDQIATDVTGSNNAAFAAAGRDGSPGNAMAVARGVAAGQAPVIAAQYNTDVANQLGAASSLYGAGNTTYGLLNGTNATANSNIQAGIGAAPTAFATENAGANATLAAEAQRFGIPVSQLTTLLGAISPVAAQFGQQTGTGHSEGESTMSGAQQFATIAGGIGSMMPRSPISFGAR